MHRQIHHALKQQKSKPFKQIKLVVHKPPHEKFETPVTTQHKACNESFFLKGRIKNGRLNSLRRPTNL